MEVEGTSKRNLEKVKLDIDQNCLKVKRKALEVVLEQCQRALELLNDTGFIDDEDDDDDDDDNSIDKVNNCSDSCSTSAASGDKETDELCDLLKSRVECPDFLEKLESAQASTLQNVPEGSSWDVVNENDLWGESGSFELDKDNYVFVKQEDIVDAMASFMATYLMSIKQTKDLSPSQLQEALGKTLNVKKKKGKLQKAWDGSKVVYNVASWGATAVGIYQNPVILKVASAAFWTSCHVISKLF